jgi:hypothetical protein
MSNLAKIEQFDINSLDIDNTSKQIYLSHHNFPKVKEYQDKNEVSSEIDTLVNFTFAYKGHSPASEREYEFTTTALKEDIFINFSNYTIEEIKLAFKLGVRGELGEYYGLNAKTFYDWLKSYRTKFLHPTLNNIMKLLPQKEVEIPAQEIIDNNNKVLICNFLEEYKISKDYTFNDFGNLIYDFFNKLEIISISKDEKEQILNQSKNQLKVELSERNENLSKLGKVYHKIDLKKAFQDIELDESKDYQTRIVTIAKKIALKRFIDTCIETDLDLETLINEKLKEYGSK